MEKEDLKIPIKKMILDIGSMREKVKELLENGHDFQRLLEAILENDYYYHDDLPMPSAKQLSEKTGLRNKKLREQVKQVYSELIFRSEDNSWRNPEFIFKETIYNFIVTGINKKHISFSVKNLKILPRVGETLEIPFFRAYLGICFFHVEKIFHDFSDTTHAINLFLNPGAYNLFWHLRRDKALLLGEIDIKDLLELEDFEVKKKIKLNR